MNASRDFVHPGNSALLLSQQAVKELPNPDPIPDAEAVREQLNRLLAHPLFTNSKRYPVLLAYAVEQTLLGNAAELKERTVGVEAFGRSPDYDVNLDPVVRTSAAEVRRRLAQYYYDSAHASELVIELYAGSYVPSFRKPVLADPQAQNSDRAEPKDGPENIMEIAPVPKPSSGAFASLPPRMRRWTPAVVAALLALAVGIGIGRYHHAPAPSNMQRFWAPMTASQNLVTYCLGEPFDSIDRRDRMAVGVPITGELDPSDVITLAHAIVPLVPRHDSFRVISAANANFAQLREGPDVLIGAFDNAWTMRITKNLRFGFDDSDGIQKLIDRKHPQQFWTVLRHSPDRRAATDYAIVARIQDSVTGEPVIIAAGIMGEGTEAASEVLYNPTYLNALLAKTPKDWDQKNLEAVIRTQVIDGHPGPPEILDVASW